MNLEAEHGQTSLAVPSFFVNLDFFNSPTVPIFPVKKFSFFEKNSVDSVMSL